MIHPQGLLSAVNNCELCFSWFLRYCPLPYCFFLDFKPYPSKTGGTPVLCLLTAPSSTTNSQFPHLSSYLLKSSKRIYIYKYNWHLQVMLMCTQPWRITFTEVYWNATFLHLHLLLLCQFSAPVIFASGRINLTGCFCLFLSSSPAFPFRSAAFLLMAGSLGEILRRYSQRLIQCRVTPRCLTYTHRSILHALISRAEAAALLQ